MYGKRCVFRLSMIKFYQLLCNTTVYESTGESPSLFLHEFDVHVPWDSSGPEISKYTVYMESYIQELTIGTQIAREYAQDVDKKMRNRMKIAYDGEKR
ncbi:hypothetical protein ANCDUO_16621, partial [Ancylostoma duodenale]